MLLSGPSLAISGVIIWAKFVFYHCLSRNTLKWCFGTFCWIVRVARKSFRGYYLGQVPFLCCNKHGRENNPYLAQIIVPQNGILFALFCTKEGAEIPILAVFFEHQPKFAQSWAPHNNTFLYFKNAGYWTMTSSLQPPTSPTFGVS